ncbi:MFS transporter [Brachyspira aalborgi]|uniref:MFS transporter n=1 Tax=Brachyspira aalborgi TaxID=29522 RepID=A0A5C8FQR9_9SPIR|nr:MFS transporter [Brachyspira aalborgi]TXJ51821.1 MFS transporter [Brachyspira aalborgi]
MIILIYSLPFILYLCSGIFSTVLVINLSYSGESAFFISLLAVFYGMGMMVCAGIFSKLKISKKFYPKLLYIEACMQAIISFLCIFFMNWQIALLYSFFYGANVTIFFVCFQSLLDSISKDLPIRISVGLFIFSWTFGLAIGPIISGLIYELNPNIGFIIVILMSILMFILFYMSRHLHLKNNKHKWEEAFTRAPRYKVYIGWLILFVGASVLHTLRFMFIDYGIKEIGLSKELASFLSGSLAGFMAIGSLISAFHIKFLERKRVFTIIGLLTPIALSIILITNNSYLLLISFLFLGLVSGFGYFFGLYYALADQENSTSNVAVNEALTGIAALIMPFIFGYIASNLSYFMAFLFMMIISLICYTIAIYIMWQKKRTAMLKEKFNNLVKRIDDNYRNK